MLDNAELQVTLEANKLGNACCKDAAETQAFGEYARTQGAGIRAREARKGGTGLRRKLFGKQRMTRHQEKELRGVRIALTAPTRRQRSSS